ncbi:unnamed protein product [Enterobius vermicularis]|uniref:Uncharacterized protein n=1 Tax=Enterobius vermicularis TaxID=51028 RepID=A0A0N4VBH9_ENTVE|nr:unnamed protein product [Enterobius vermicularis]
MKIQLENWNDLETDRFSEWDICDVRPDLGFCKQRLSTGSTTTVEVKVSSNTTLSPSSTSLPLPASSELPSSSSELSSPSESSSTSSLPLLPTTDVPFEDDLEGSGGTDQPELTSTTEQSSTSDYVTAEMQALDL